MLNEYETQIIQMTWIFLHQYKHQAILRWTIVHEYQLALYDSIGIATFLESDSKKYFMRRQTTNKSTRRRAIMDLNLFAIEKLLNTHFVLDIRVIVQSIGHYKGWMCVRVSLIYKRHIMVAPELNFFSLTCYYKNDIKNNYFKLLTHQLIYFVLIFFIFYSIFFF